MIGLRVLLIDHSPKHTGLATYVSNLYRALLEKRVPAEIADISDPTGLGFVSSPAHRIRRAVEILDGLRKLPKGFDIYHATSQFLSLSCAVVAPSVVTFHDTAGFLSRRDAAAAILFRLDFSFAKLAQMVICPSEFARKETVAQFRLKLDRVKVVQPGIDHSLFHERDKAWCRKRLGLPTDGKLMLSVSTTLKHKNIPGLLKAFQIIARKQPNARLIRVGSPSPTTPELNALAEHLGISDRINYKKPSSDELAMLYNASDVLVHTSTYEGFGGPLVEAMASGVPVVASNAASIPEVVGDAAILVNPLDIDAFASETLNVLTDDSLATKLTEHGIMRSRLFSWEKCATDTLTIYDTVSRLNHNPSDDSRSNNP
jgi:glycosyltransferase involved in cell wall biosynthesis